MSIPRNAAVALVIGLSIVLAQPEDATAVASRGQVLSQQWCSQCHAVKPSWLSLDPAAPSFPDISAEPSTTEYSLRVFLRTPHPTMPNFVIGPGDVDDIVSYIISLKPRR
jgi:cytochrome c